MNMLRATPAPENDRCAERLGLVKDAVARCPVCNGFFNAYRRADDPRKKPIVETRLGQLRSTCGDPRCAEKEGIRYLKPTIDRAFDRYEEERKAVATKEKELAEKRIERQAKSRLSQLGETQ